MKSNLGSTDKIIRIAIALTVAVLYYTKVINGVLALILSSIAIIFVFTSLINFCPLYKLLGISSKKEKK